jgi:hypothetical protein
VLLLLNTNIPVFTDDHEDFFATTSLDVYIDAFIVVNKSKTADVFQILVILCTNSGECILIATALLSPHTAPHHAAAAYFD